jgi:hypothetical protein
MWFGAMRWWCRRDKVVVLAVEKKGRQFYPPFYLLPTPVKMSSNAGASGVCGLARQRGGTGAPKKDFRPEIFITRCRSWRRSRAPLAQAEYVVWRDSVVSAGQPKKNYPGTAIILPTADPGDKVAHRWRKRSMWSGGTRWCRHDRGRWPWARRKTGRSTRTRFTGSRFRQARH